MDLSQIRDYISKPPCDIVQSNGELIGQGYYTLISIEGIKKIKLPWRVDVAGPSEVYNNYCSSYFILQPQIHFLWIIPAVIFLTSLLVILPMIRFKMLKKRLIKSGYKGHMTMRSYRLQGPSGDRKITYLRLVLYMYCLSNATEGCIEVNRFIGNESFFTVNAYPGEVICTKDGITEIPKLYSEFPLSNSYESHNWKHKRVHEWGCGGGSCPYVEDCEKMNNLEEMTDEYVLEKSFCNNYPKACAFSRGCIYGKDIILMDSDKIEILKPIYLNEADIDSKITKGCKLRPSAKQNFQLEPILPVYYKTKYYICQNVAIRGQPLSGFIGDIQRVGNNILFAWNSIKCLKDWFSPDSCEYIKHLGLEKECLLLPNVYEGYKLSINKGYLVIESDVTSLTYLGECKNEFISKRDSCFDTQSKIIGERHSANGIYLEVVSNSISKSELMNFTLNCNDTVLIKFICDGMRHLIPVPEMNNCKNLEDATIESEGFNELSVHEYEPSYLNVLKLHDSHKPITVSIIFISIIISLILIFICKK